MNNDPRVLYQKEKISERHARTLHQRIVPLTKYVGKPNDIEKILEHGRAEITWKTKEEWRVRNKMGRRAVVESLSYGHFIEMPLGNPSSWNRFIVGHEVAHTLFYDPERLDPPHWVEIAKNSPGGRCSAIRDVYNSGEEQEEICDEISDIIFIPRANVLNVLESNKPRLQQAYDLAVSSNMPLDRSFKRRGDVLDQVKGYTDIKQCSEIIIWEYDGENVFLHPTFLTGYKDNILTIQNDWQSDFITGRQTLEEVGLETFVNSKPNVGDYVHLQNVSVSIPNKKSRKNPLSIDQKSKMVNMESPHNIEILKIPPYKGNDRYLATYDRLDNKKGRIYVEPYFNI